MQPSPFTNSSFSQSLNGYADGDYILSVATTNQSGYFDNGFYEFRVIIENGTSFFYKDFAHENNAFSEGVLNTFIKYNDVTNTSYLGSGEQILKEASNQITSGCSTDYDKVKAIYLWVSKNILYTMDSSGDSLEVYNSKKAVCYGYSNLVTALCRAQGIKCYTVCGGSIIGASYLQEDPGDRYTGEGVGAHAWNAYYIDGKWRYCDATWAGGNLIWFAVASNYFSLRHYNLTIDTDLARDGDFGYFYVGGYFAVQSYTGNSTSITLPSYLDSQIVNSTGWQGFSGNKVIKPLYYV